MASLNKVMLIGNLTKDPEMRFLANGNAMAKFGMAVNRTWTSKEGKKEENVTFFNLVAFAKAAETLTKYCKKGHRLFVDGRLDANTVTNEKGEKRTFHNVVVNGFQFLSTAPRKDGDGGHEHAEDPSLEAPAEAEDDDE